jgi:hypothetical protein
MGAKGGYQRIIRWRCTTCGEDCFERKDGAANCCNDSVWKARQRKRDTNTKRAMTTVLKVIRMKVSKSDYGDGYVLSGRCQMAQCKRYGYGEIILRVSKRWDDKKWTAAIAKTRGRGLFMAQLMRHCAKHHSTGRSY